MNSSMGHGGSVIVDSAAVRASLKPWTVKLAASPYGVYSPDSLGDWERTSLLTLLPFHTPLHVNKSIIKNVMKCLDP